jgi:hypothetical protein
MEDLVGLVDDHTDYLKAETRPSRAWPVGRGRDCRGIQTPHFCSLAPEWVYELLPASATALDGAEKPWIQTRAGVAAFGCWIRPCAHATCCGWRSTSDFSNPRARRDGRRITRASRARGFQGAKPLG